MRANVDVLLYDDHDRVVKLLHSLDCMVWGRKFEAFVELEKYDTLTVDRLQDENDEVRKLMGWLSGHEPQLRIMIETYKRQDGEGLGANKVGEGEDHVWLEDQWVVTSRCDE
jgi:hypothetical protein